MTATREEPETKQMAPRAAAAMESSSTSATKKKKTTTAATTASRKITSAQFKRYDVFIKEQEEKRGSHAFVGSHVHKECVKGVILHQSEVKPYNLIWLFKLAIKLGRISQNLMRH